MKTTLKDARGTKVKVGDRVRILAVPDLSKMSAEGRRECEWVFQHLVGTYKRIAEIDSQGNAGIWFRVRGKVGNTLRWVSIEPFLIQKPRKKQRPTSSSSHS